MLQKHISLMQVSLFFLHSLYFFKAAVNLSKLLASLSKQCTSNCSQRAASIRLLLCMNTSHSSALPIDEAISGIPGDSMEK